MSTDLAVFMGDLHNRAFHDCSVGKVDSGLAEIADFLTKIMFILGDEGRWIGAVLSDQLALGAPQQNLVDRMIEENLVALLREPHTTDPLTGADFTLPWPCETRTGCRIRKESRQQRVHSTDTINKTLALCKRVSVKQASKETDIDVRTIYSWLRRVSRHKKRKRFVIRDFEMELNLSRWIDEYRNAFGTLPSGQVIRSQALKSSTCSAFKASFAWYVKFMARDKPEHRIPNYY